jgi:hypothetical protein
MGGADFGSTIRVLGTTAPVAVAAVTTGPERPSPLARGGGVVRDVYLECRDRLLEEACIDERRNPPPLFLQRRVSDLDHI